MVALGARLADGVHEHGEQHRPTPTDEHDRREPVGDERDADRRRPAAGLRRRAVPSRSTATRRAIDDGDERGEGRRAPMTRCAARGPTRRGSTARRRAAAARSGSGEQRGHGAVLRSIDLLGDRPPRRRRPRRRESRPTARSATSSSHLVVAGEQPAAVGQREQERGDAERDDDGGERQRLGQRVGEVAGRPGADERRRRPARPTVEQQHVGAVADQRRAR